MARKEAVGSGVTRTVEIMPEDIIRDEDVNVRPWSTANPTEEDEAAIEELKRMIAAEGQLEPVRVREITNNGSGPEYHLILGSRRTEAIFRLNVERAAENKPPMKVRAEVVDGVDEPTAYRQAAMENLGRRNMSPMDLAMVVGNVRENMDWKGAKGTKRVAEYLGVSPATVVQADKLLTMDGEVQRKVHTGVLSAQAAFELKDVPEADREQVLEDARRRQEEEKRTAGEAEAEAAVNAGVGSGGGGGKRRVRQGKTEGAVKAKHIRSAARDRGLSKKPQDRGEIVAYFEKKIGNEKYGWRGGAVDLFLRAFIVWEKGQLSTGTLDKYFDGMVEKASKGDKPTKEEREKAEKAAVAESKEKAEGQRKAGQKKPASKAASKKSSPKPKK